MSNIERQCMLVGILGGAAWVFAADRLWYPPPDISGVALGLLMAAIFISGAAVAALAWWLAHKITRT